MYTTSIMNRLSSLCSPLVSQAKNYLNASMQAKPKAYQSRYEEQIAGLYNQIMNRPAFSYSAEKDPLYQQYRNQYIREGQHAMQDTAGAAAALTGGYGNSWANTAGYQAYGQYLQALNDKLPELEKRAREQYDAEGNALRDNANLAMNLDNREYGWYRDAMNDWRYDVKLAMEQQQFDLQLQKYRDEMLASLGLHPLSPDGRPDDLTSSEYGRIPEEQDYSWSKQTVKRTNNGVSGKTALAKNKTGR